MTDNPHDESNKQRVAIVGGGLGGLAAACTLAARGHRIALFEVNDWTGGKAAVLSEAGYRFDMGPTILTLPTVLRRIFAEAGQNLDDWMQLVRLNPQWRCFFEDGSTLDLADNVDQMSATLDRYAPGSGSGGRYREFIDASAQLHDVSDRFFFWRSIGSIKDMFKLGSSFNLSTLADVRALRMGKTVASTIKGFTPDARVAQMLEHFTQYVGSAPDQSPAVLCGIAHMQTQGGVWYPMGGTAAVPAALTKLAKKLGVEFHLSTAVKKITTESRHVTGIETADGEHLNFDAVISNMDAVRTTRELLDGEPRLRAERRKDYEPACSGVVLYLGLSRKYDHLLHHNFVFSKNPHDEFDSIYRRVEPAADPTCYVCAPACTDSSVAPAGGEALYVLVHTPYLRPHHDWSSMISGYRNVILDKLARVAGMPDIRDRVVVERVLTPQDIHDRYHVLQGAIYGVASHGRFLGAFKPANRSAAVKGLYLAGGAAHPGPGMPMVLMSGWIAADALDQDSQKAPSGKRVPAARG
jgi:diapolycopene oxygenase